eukprot:17891-Heterococcus_DN1.PRE.2
MHNRSSVNDNDKSSLTTQLALAVAHTADVSACQHKKHHFAALARLSFCSGSSSNSSSSNRSHSSTFQCTVVNEACRCCSVLYVIRRNTTLSTLETLAAKQCNNTQASFHCPLACTVALPAAAAAAAAAVMAVAQC